MDLFGVFVVNGRGIVKDTGAHWV